MRPPSRRTVALLVVGVAVAAAGGWIWRRASSPLVLDAPSPRMAADVRDTLPAAPPTAIDAEVCYNLKTAVDSLEAFVPRNYGDIEKKLPIASNTRASFAFAVSRSPFRVRVTGQTLAISADVEYEGRVWYRPPIGPELSASCGTGNAPRPRVRATLVSTARLTPDWKLRTWTRVLRLEPYSGEHDDRCRLTALRIDVTDRVIEATRRLLDQDVERFDEAVSRWPVRSKFVKLWSQLQRPIRLTRDVYLEIDPYAVQLGSLAAVEDTVMLRLSVIAAPRIVAGARPGAVRALPALARAGPGGGSAHVVVGASFTYPVATELLRHALVGRSITQNGHHIRILDVKLTGIGGGRVALGVRLAGRVRGMLYFTGTPSLDSTRHQVDVPDLEYDVGTAQLLVKGLGWLRGVDVRDYLRERARLPDSAVVGKLRLLAESGINRTLAPGVTLSGRIHDARGTGVRATTQEIRLSAVADAEFKLSIDRAPAFPRARSASHHADRLPRQRPETNRAEPVAKAAGS